MNGGMALWGEHSAKGKLGMVGRGKKHFSYDDTPHCLIDLYDELQNPSLKQPVV